MAHLYDLEMVRYDGISEMEVTFHGWEITFQTFVGEQVVTALLKAVHDINALCTKEPVDVEIATSLKAKIDEKAKEALDVDRAVTNSLLAWGSKLKGKHIALTYLSQIISPLLRDQEGNEKVLVLNPETCEHGFGTLEVEVLVHTLQQLCFCSVLRVERLPIGDAGAGAFLEYFFTGKRADTDVNKNEKVNTNVLSTREMSRTVGSNSNLAACDEVFGSNRRTLQTLTLKNLNLTSKLTPLFERLITEPCHECDSNQVGTVNPMKETFPGHNQHTLENVLPSLLPSFFPFLSFSLPSFHISPSLCETTFVSYQWHKAMFHCSQPSFLPSILPFVFPFFPSSICCTIL